MASHHNLLKYLYLICIIFYAISSQAHTETVKIKVSDKEHDAISVIVPKQDSKGTLLIMPDPRYSINEPLTLTPLRLSLMHRFWSSLTMPSFEEPEKTTASLIECISYLSAEDKEPIYLVTVAENYEKGLKYLVEKKDKKLSGIIMISPFPYAPEKIDPLIAKLIKQDIPVLIVSGQQDFDNVLETGQAFQKAFNKEGSDQLRLREILGTRYRDKLFTDYASRSIVSWLYYLQHKN